jgi:DNA-binding MarR family transcriptional regulator
LQCSELRYGIFDNRTGKYVNMADIKLDATSKAVSLVELLFFAYRDFVADPDHMLEDFGFGRAHHRVVHFVGRDPGLTVAELLDILKITKQSLARVLKELIDKGHVFQKAGANDRRQRLLYLTAEGEALRARLMGPQIARFERAFTETGFAPEQFHAMLLHLVDPENQKAAEEWSQGLKQRG